MGPAVEWAEPPPDGRGRTKTHGKHDDLIAKLRARRGEWAKLGTYRSSSYAARWQSGRIAGTKPGEFEAVCRKTADGKYDVYVRYLGEVA